MRLLSYCTVALILICISQGCASKTEVKKQDSSEYNQSKIAQIYEKKYPQLNWRDKVKVFSDFSEQPIIEADYPLFDKGFSDENDQVTLAVFKGIGDKKIEEFRPHFVKLLNHKNNVIRYKALLQIYRLQAKPEDLDYAQKGLEDKEWMVQEISLRIIRKFAAEKVEKKAYYSVLFTINVKNPTIVQEVFKTLRWYNDERSFDYMHKRAQVVDNNLELIYLIKELSYYKNFKVQAWLRTLRDNHDSALVRNVAREALNKK